MAQKPRRQDHRRRVAGRYSRRAERRCHRCLAQRLAHLQDWEDSTLRDEASECAHREGLPQGVTRFILLGRWVNTYDAWNGEHDAWIEDKELVPLERDRELRHMCKTTKPKKEDDARSR